MPMTESLAGHCSVVAYEEIQENPFLYNWRASEAIETLSGVTQSRFHFHLYSTYILFFAHAINNVR